VRSRPVCRIKDETSFEADNSGDQPGEVRLPVPMLIGSSSDRVFIRKTGKRVEMQSAQQCRPFKAARAASKYP
jgi:hypothetical protein